MKTTEMLTILVLILASMANGAQKLTVNDQDVNSITLKVGQSCTVEVVSNDTASYEDYVGFDNGLVLGSFSHLQTKPAAGNQAAVIEVNEPDFYGYYVRASGIIPGKPSPGIHFVFQYTATQLGETILKLYDDTLTLLKDSVHITVIPVEVGTAFTYQGRLIDANNAADGLYDFQFKLYDSPDATIGTQQGSTIDINELDVIDGYFTAGLDFGSVFDGNALWLDIGVRPGAQNDPNVYTTLSPRQKVTPTPYALQTRGIFVDNTGNVGIGTTTPANKLEVAGVVVGTSGLMANTARTVGIFDDGSNGMTVRIGNNDERIRILSNGNVGIGTTNPGYKLTVAGGVIGIDQDQGIRAGGNWLLGQDSGTNLIHIGSAALANDIRFDNNTTNGQVIIKGTSGNVGIGTTSPAAKLDVSGDISTTSVYKIGNNTVLSVAGTENTFTGIGAGQNNTNGRYNTFTGGYAGQNNEGSHNTFIGDMAGAYADGSANVFIGWGAGSYAMAGPDSSGSGNVFIGLMAGYANNGSGNVFIGNLAGYNTELGLTGSNKLYIATNLSGAGALIYGDFSANTLGFGTTSIPAGRAINTATGAYLTTGGAWTNNSSRDVKENITPVDGRNVLEKLVKVPVSIWNYKVEDKANHHMGPMAQDLYEAFKLGDSDKSIATIDGDGISLAAIQGLYQIVKEKDSDIAALKKENEDIKARLAAMESQMTRLSLQQEGGTQ